jgi:hypothetical protein
MKPCKYCGRDNEDNKNQCRECGTPFEASEPAGTASGRQAGFTGAGLQPWFVVLFAIAALYLPCFGSLLTNDRWSDKMATLKDWPTLPGRAVSCLLMEPHRAGPLWVCITVAIGILMLAWALCLRRKPAIAILPVLLLSLLIGVVVRGLYAA